VGMRWWLASVFVVIAALTAALIAAVSSRQADRRLRANAENIAVGATVAAGFAVERAIREGDLQEQLVPIGAAHGLALFVFGRDRRLVGESNLRGIEWRDVPGRGAALASALRGHRFFEAVGNGRVVIGLPLRRTEEAAALVGYQPRPPGYGAPLTIFRNEVVRASIWAVLAAALTGLVAATLIARRLRGIASAAAAIEQGDFALELRPRFGDEIGRLAATIDRMRRRLGDAFAQLSAERDQLGLLLEQLHEGVLAVDRRLRIRYANANARALLPGVVLEADAPLPDTYEDLPLRRVAQGLFAPGAAVAEARARRDDGATLSLVGVPAAASDFAVLVLADITEQERRRRAEREFVTNASHELRTPVTAIASAVEALKAGAQDSPESRERFVDLIGRQAARLTRLTSALLTLARAETRQEELQLEPVELEEVLREVAASADAADGVAVRVECPRPVVAVAQRDIVEQVVASLVGNALKHAASDEIVLRARLADSRAVIEVADSGPGIPPAVQERMFDRFYSGGPGRRDGFGLGLAIAHASTEAIGGRLTIHSAAGRGTTATVVLPAGEAS